jgi:hypothetical protein
MSAATWTLKGQTALASSADWSAAIDLGCLGRGVGKLSVAGESLPVVDCLGIVERCQDTAVDSDWSARIEDAYVRHRDLIVIYGECSTSPLRVQVYWRLLDDEQCCGAAAGFDLIVSVNTSRLGIKPDVWATSRYASDTQWNSARYDASAANWSSDTSTNAPGDCLLLEPAGSEHAFGVSEMIHPRDRKSSFVGRDPAGESFTRHLLFDDVMEKGVIVRARLRAIVVPTAAARRITESCCEQFTHEPLPLTT